MQNLALSALVGNYLLGSYQVGTNSKNGLSKCGMLHQVTVWQPPPKIELLRKKSENIPSPSKDSDQSYVRTVFS